MDANNVPEFDDDARVRPTTKTGFDPGFGVLEGGHLVGIEADFIDEEASDLPATQDAAPSSGRRSIPESVLDQHTTTEETATMLQTEAKSGRQSVRDESKAWAQNAARLATWTQERMVNRRDTHGMYYVHKGATGSCTEHKVVDHNLIRRHFADGRIIGLHSTSTDDLCRWLTIDVDQHGDSKELAARNHRFALALYKSLRRRGFNPLLLDSNGKGGLHLIVLFDEPSPAAQVRAFGRWLVRNWERLGLPRQPEVFPKQDSIIKADGTVGLGNFVRLFGKHHKRDFYTRVWDGDAWLPADAAIEYILALQGDSFDLVPEEARSYRPPKEKNAGRGRQWWKAYDGDLRTLDIIGLFESQGLWAHDVGGDQLEVECPWAADHSDGRDVAYIEEADPGGRFFARFCCHHAHCQGRRIADVLEHFGREAVNGHCRERYAGRRGASRSARDAATAINPGDPMGVARAFQARQGHLVHHDSEWRRWDDGRFVVVSEGVVEAELRRWLESCSAPDQDVSRPYKLDEAAVGGYLDALKSVVQLS